ncbi:hypothetical protein LJC49_11135 [Ruminococcaceae bacterium OttesenSCG-928-I18]|nr:hypothetical protein [Ruminococcaceae bacterium OttesenSCG-928-I18]
MRTGTLIGPGLRDKVMELYSQQYGINDKLKKIDRRLKTLGEHLQYTDSYLEHRAIHHQYKQQKPNRKAAFYEAHRAELTLYEAAKKYLTGAERAQGSPAKGMESGTQKIDYRAAGPVRRILPAER